MIRFYFTLLLMTALQDLPAQVNIFDPATIPAELKKNANSVKREERILFEVKSPDKAWYKLHKVVAVLNEAGRDELVFFEFTDKFISLEELSIEIFDGQGKSKNKYGKEDLVKETAGEGLVPEGKIYYLRIPALTFPVTIQTDYTIRYNGILNYPDYAVQLPEQAVENSQFTVKIPADLDLRYKGKNTSLVPDRKSVV